MSNHHFLLVGNGPFANRGCEAIVRGTMRILRQEFGESIRVTVASFGSPALIRDQAAAEYDTAITHVALGIPATDKWSRAWFQRQANKLLHPCLDPAFLPLKTHHPALNEPLMTAVAALEIGGDNYSLDYGWPEPFLGLDRFIQSRRCPIVLWGASVGPFDSIPAEGQSAMFRHLSSLNAILIRESASQDYLVKHGCKNLFSVSDPAFAMEPRKPDLARVGFRLPDKPIGLNFSPLMAHYVTGGKREEWIALCAAIVRYLADSTDRPILLIPHVTSTLTSSDDAALLQQIRLRPELAGKAVFCLPGIFNAAETKWVIGQCSIFAGARTHATIAAISQGIPTLSFAYSTKAIGINRDIFGSEAYCVKAVELRNPEMIAARILSLLADAKGIRNHLQSRLPAILADSFAAGPILRGVLTSAERNRI